MLMKTGNSKAAGGMPTRALALGLALIALVASPVMADAAPPPGTAGAPIDADLAPQPDAAAPTGPTVPPPPAAPTPVPAIPSSAPAATAAPATSPDATASAAPATAAVPTAKAPGYQEDDLVGAAEGVFGKGAKGLALTIRNILKKQGQPIGYITGREAGGAFVVGLRYGSGTLHHKIEGERPVYWTGPSVGFDFGANGGEAFVLVYNLYDTEDLFTRFAAGEGQAYFVGGFHVSYLRHGNIVLIPVRLGVGLRLGVSGGYMKVSRKQNWQPF